MKLLLDENLSPSLVGALSSLYPESVHVRDVESAPDGAVWEYAARTGYTIVTKDADFRQRSFLYGPPPKVIYVKLGNCSTRQIEGLLRGHHFQVVCFETIEEASFLSLG